MNDTITLNPSLLGFQPVASFSGTFNWIDGSQVASDDQSRTYNVSVIDGKNQYVNAGLSFTRRHDLDFIHVALAKRVVPWLSVGASTKRFSTRSNARAASGDAVSGIEAGVSASVVLPKEISSTPIQIGLTADNLLHRVSDEPYVGPRQAGVGAKATIQSILMLYGDLVENFPHAQGAYLQWAAGAEVALGGGFFGRGGKFGGKREDGWSFGGGWVGPRLGVSYGYQNRMTSAERTYDHAVTMDIYM